MNWQGAVAHRSIGAVAHWPSSLSHHREKPSSECSGQLSEPLTWIYQDCVLAWPTVGNVIDLFSCRFPFSNAAVSLWYPSKVVKCYPLMVLVWIYLMPGDVKHVLTGNLYIFFRGISIQLLCLFVNRVFLLVRFVVHVLVEL